MTSLKAAAILVLTAAGTACASNAMAQTIAYTSYENLGKHSYQGPQSVGTAGYHLGYLPSGYIALAASFVPTTTGTLDYLELALGSLAGFPAATVTLVPDNGSGAPDLSDPVLETLLAQKLPLGSGVKTRSTKLVSAAKPSLTAGQTYWIILTTAAYDGNLMWYQSDTVSQRVIYTNDGGQNFTGYTSHQAAFEVVVNTSES